MVFCKYITNNSQSMRPYAMIINFLVISCEKLSLLVVFVSNGLFYSSHIASRDGKIVVAVLDE